MLTAEFLQVAYVEEGRTLHSIAAEVGCSATTVSRWLANQGIPTRRVKPGVDNLLYNEVLNDEYVRARLSEGATLRDLAQEAGCTTTAVALAAERAGARDLIARYRAPMPPVSTADELRRLYSEERLSLEAIARRLGVSRMKVRADLDRYGIRPYRRPPASDVARRRRAVQRAQLDDEAIIASYARLRKQHRPEHIDVLLIGAAPPAPRGRDPFFYESGPRMNPLLRCVAEALYEGLGLPEAAEVHARLKADGIWMIEVCNRPFTETGPTARRQVLVRERDAFVRRVLTIGANGVVLCHRQVWEVMAGALTRSGVRLLHAEPIPYPVVDPRGCAALLRDSLAGRR